MTHTTGKLSVKRRYRYLLEAVRQTRPRRILEIGTWKGKHARLMIEEALKHKEVEYYGFDLFEQCSLEEFPKSKWTSVPFEKIKSALEKTGAKIFLFKGNTRETLAQARLPLMDFIFIDGGHSLETVQSDWEHCEKLMHSKTVLVFDDYWDRTDGGCKTLVDRVIRVSGKYKVNMLGEVDHADVSDIQMVKVTQKDAP
ncbi:MAG: class I SAM-dependent methyltransferase [Candidatus Omnitrophica bacterium]|nr:class I SAM-dependent methyltransferase [Candidatus Omnitrophota bacterium]